MASRIEPVKQETTNDPELTMRLDTDGVHYPREMHYDDAPAFWRAGRR